MSDIVTATPADTTMAVLREREHELELQVRDSTGRLEELREMIARINARKARPARRLRTPEERLAERIAQGRTFTPGRHAEPGTPHTIDAALAALGRTVAERDAELETV